MSIDVEAFRQRWVDRWPDSRPGDHWWFDRTMKASLFFSSLPQSKGNAESAVEFAESLHRHHETLVELLELSSQPKDAQLILITRSWSSSSEPVSRDPWVNRLVPALYFESFTQDPPGETDDDPAWAHVYLTDSSLADGSLASMLLLVAGDETAMTAITTPSMEWLYEPWRNGGSIWGITDVMATELRERHSDWLPVERSLPRQPVGRDIPGWEFVTWWMPKESAERLSEVAEAEDLLVANGHVVDPRSQLSVRFDRQSAQLLKIALSAESGDAVDPFTQSTRRLTPTQAKELLESHYSLNGQLDDFLVGYGYRLPSEAVDGVLDGKFWDPAQDYTGIDGTRQDSQPQLDTRAQDRGSAKESST